MPITIIRIIVTCKAISRHSIPGLLHHHQGFQPHGESVPFIIIRFLIISISTIISTQITLLLWLQAAASSTLHHRVDQLLVHQIQIRIMSWIPAV